MSDEVRRLKFVPYATIVCVSKGASAWRERCFLSYCLFFLIVKRAQKLVFSFFSFSL